MTVDDSSRSGRDAGEVARALRALEAAAHTAVVSGCTPDEVLDAYEKGVAGALDGQATRRAAEQVIAENLARFAPGHAAA